MEPKYEHTITVTDNKHGYSTYKLKAKSGYASDVGLLAKAVDTGNGYIFKFPSYSACYSDKYLNIGYDEIEYVAEIYKLIEEGV